MKVYLLSALFSFTSVTLAASIWTSLNEKDKVINNISCASNHEFYYGQLLMDARYYFSFAQGKGVIRINGRVKSNDKEYPVSRDISYSYFRTGDDYTMTSTQVEDFSDDKNIQQDMFNRLPSFFSVAGRQFSFTLKYDRFKNPVFFYNNLPVFYCVRNSI